MRALFVVHQFFPSDYTGTERLVLDTCRQMRRCGHSVDVLTYERGIDEGWQHDYVRDGVRVKEYEYRGVPVLSLRYEEEPEDVALQVFPEQAEALLRGILPRYELLHVFHPMRVGGTAAKVAAGLGIPVVLTLTDFWLICPRGILLTRDGRLCEGTGTPWKCLAECYDKQHSAPVEKHFQDATQLLGIADRVCAPTRFLAAVFEKRAQVASTFVPYGIDYARFVRETPGTRGTALRLGFVGTVLRHKGVHVLIDAVRRTDADLDVRIHGGCFEQEEYLQRLRAIADGDPRISFRGAYDYSDVAAIMADLDAVVVPSLWWENAPFTVLTAFAFRKPVIASDLGGISEVVEDGVNGFLFEPGNADSLARVLQRVAEDPALLETARKGIVRPRRIEEAAFDYERIYADLLRRGTVGQ